MKIITLHISTKPDNILSFDLLSLDPKARSTMPSYDVQLSGPIEIELANHAGKILGALNQRNEQNFKEYAKAAADCFLNQSLIEILSSATEEYLYFDLDLSLIGFPWECLAISRNLHLGDKFKIGRNIRIPQPIDSHHLEGKPKIAIIANPDNSLPEAESEGVELLTIFGKKYLIDYKSNNVTKSEVLASLAECDLFHFAGHCTGSDLVLADGLLSFEQIKGLVKVPYFVFINSCHAANPSGWADSANSIAKTFILGGTHVFISPITRIETSIAKSFAMNFYKSLVQHDPVANALESGNQSAAGQLCWANYVLYSNPMYILGSRVVTETTPYKRLILGALAVVCSLILAFFWSSSKPSTKLDTSDLDMRLVEDACEAGDGHSCFTLYTYFNSRNKVDLASYFIGRACHFNKGIACVQSADILLAGKKFEEAFAIGDKLCIEDDENCAHFALKIYMAGYRDKAKLYFSMLCDHGNGMGCNGLGLIYEELGEFKLSNLTYEKGCKFNDSLSCGNFSQNLMKTGKHLEASTIMLKYCNSQIKDGCLDLAKAKFHLGEIQQSETIFQQQCDTNPMNCLEAGDFFASQQGFSAAIRFYKIACELGKTKGCDQIIKYSNYAPEDICFNKPDPECYDMMIRLTQSGNSDTPLSYHERLCKRNYYQSCNALGVLYLESNEYERSEPLLKKACENNNYLGCNSLGNLKELQNNHDAAFSNYKKACDQNIVLGCTNIWSSWKERDPKLAQEFLDKACALDDMVSCAEAGLANRILGHFEQAHNQFKKGCTSGLDISCLHLGLLHFEKTIYEDSIKWFELGCELKNTDACNFAQLAKGFLKVDTNDYQSAKEHFAQICNDKIAQGCAALGLVYEKLGEKTNAANSYLTACTKKPPAGCAEYGLYKIKGGSFEIADAYCKGKCTKLYRMGCYCEGKLKSKNGAVESAEEFFDSACQGQPEQCPSVAKKTEDHRILYDDLTAFCQARSKLSCKPFTH